MYKLAWMSACSLTHEKPLWGSNNKVCMELMANAHNTSSKWLMQSLNFGASRSRGRVQGVCTPPPPMTCGFPIQLVFCKKKTMWFIGVGKRRVHPLMKKILDPPQWIVRFSSMPTLPRSLLHQGYSLHQYAW